MTEPDLRPKDHLRMGVDFGTVCRRCGARLLDEVVVTVTIGRHVSDPRTGFRDTQAYVWPLCEPCSEPVWAPLVAATLPIRTGSRRVGRSGGGAP